MKQNYRDEKWIGSKFGRLTVIAFEHIMRGKTGCWNWIVRCECGTLKSVSPYRVLTGNTVSCGCHKSEMASITNKKNKTTHGGKYDRLYTIWSGMKQRCYCRTNKDYPNWGGRGIKVCDEWLETYANFRDWANKNGYAEGLSLDRIDVNGNYEPSNCRFADNSTQANNRRSTIFYEYHGKKESLAQIAHKSGVKYGTLYARVNRCGMNVEDAATNTDRRRAK